MCLLYRFMGIISEMAQIITYYLNLFAKKLKKALKIEQRRSNILQGQARF